MHAVGAMLPHQNVRQRILQAFGLICYQHCDEEQHNYVGTVVLKVWKRWHRGAC
jgi:hypothetical protein